MKKFILVCLLTIFVTACFGPFARVIQLDQESVARLQKEIIVYNKGQLEGKNYRIIQAITATSCKNKIWDPAPSREDAINQLRFLSASLGGNGITNIACGGEGTNLVKNCWASVTCYGSAIFLEELKEKK